MRWICRIMVTLLATAAVSAMASPVQAARTTEVGDYRAGSEAGVLKVGETISGSAQVTATAESCLWVYYHLTQVEPTKVKLRYGLEDPCKGHQVMNWATRSDRFDGDGAAGAVKHREWTCYTCHKIWRNVYMFDPKGTQKFQMMTVHIGLTGSNHTNDVLRGEVFRT